MVLTLWSGWAGRTASSFSDPPRQKLELRRLAASDLAQVVLSKVVQSHLAKSDNGVWEGFYSNAAG